MKWGKRFCGYFLLGLFDLALATALFLVGVRMGQADGYAAGRIEGTTEATLAMIRRIRVPGDAS